MYPYGYRRRLTSVKPKALRLQPEIGLRILTALDARQAPVDRNTVAAAVEGACACLEVVHSTWTGYRFNLEQNTADSSPVGQVVVRPRLPLTDLMARDAVAVHCTTAAARCAGAWAPTRTAIRWTRWRDWRGSWLLSICGWRRGIG